MAPVHDIVVVGAGIAGGTLALALARAAGLRLDIALVDRAPSRPPHDDIRAYAIAAGSRRLLEEIGVWSRIAGAAQAVTAMDITDVRIAELIRPVLASFEDEARADDPFVHFVEARHLQAALAEALSEAGLAVSWDRRLSRLSRDDHHMRLGFGDDEIAARLVVGADGARSAVRRLGRLGEVGWRYGQSALVALIAHEAPHEGRAVQHFLPGGPLALLPLPGNRSGMVWTVSKAEAERLMGLAPADFAAELARAVGPERGGITVEEGPRAQPLELGVARRFAAPRLALVGDAAHRVHPLAGQGLNLGFRDVAALAEVVAEATRRGEDIGAGDVLARYQRWRRFDTVQMAALTDGLNRLFAPDWPPLRAVRDFGLGVVGRMPRLERLLIREAAGEAGRPPRLLSGEPV